MRLSTLVVRLALCVAVLGLTACYHVGSLESDGGIDGDSDAGGDSDNDSDSDSDSDSDADTDADTDTGTGTVDRVGITTSMGFFVVALYSEEMPLTVGNFLSYVDEGFYDGLIFHRVIQDFVVQGGAYDADLDEKPAHDPIELEICDGLSHQPGTVGAARGPEPDSETSQFFINVADNSHLDGDYALFGVVESGYEVVEAISMVETETVGPFEDVPVEPVYIVSAVRLDF